MDRTTIAPYKAEEKELGEKLYAKLDGLTLIYPPNEEFKRQFSKDMFLKPNQSAFFQVFHYLFRIHDAAEFKKRFYWPLTDKRSESSFRSSTVEYLKFLSEKHNLNWNVKSFLVQMPGGMKFILFLLDVVGFIIAEQIRQREKQLGLNVPAEGFSELTIKSMQKKHQFLLDYVADYVGEAEQQKKNLRLTTDLIKAELYKIESVIEVDIDKQFLSAFEKSNEELYETSCMTHNQRILGFEDNLKDLKSSIDIYLQKAQEQRKEQSSLRQTLKRLYESGDDVGVKPTMEHLIAAFDQIQPHMENFLAGVVEQNASIDVEITTELLRLQTELKTIEAQIKTYQQKYENLNNTKPKELNAVEDASVNRNLISKYVFTPPTKLNLNENTTNIFPLVGDNNFIKQLDLTRSARKVKPTKNATLDLSTTLNSSQAFDSAQMLRTILNRSSRKAKLTTNSTKPASNLSMLSLKWQERQQMFADEITANMTPIKKNSSNAESGASYIDIKISSPITPFNAHTDDITRIALSSYKQSPSYKKVDTIKEDAFNIMNISTSPTGRLDALYTLDYAAKIAAIEDKEDQQKINLITTPTGLSLSSDFTTEVAANEDKENQQNCNNVQPKKILFDFEYSAKGEDLILNTSDTVLKDIEL